MNYSTPQIHLNRFPIHRLSQTETTVYIYTYIFNSSPEPGTEYSAINKITWNIGIAGVKFGSTIITKQAILEQNLKRENWTLQFQGTQLLDPEKPKEREALERLERRWLGGKLRQASEKTRVDNSSEGGFIWWNAERTILEDSGWEVHTGVRLDIDIHSSGVIFAEVDIHHRFYTPWTLEQWLREYQDLPVSWVRNTYDDRSWKFKRVSDEDPETTMIPNLGSLADYHRKLSKNQATEDEIRHARVVYVSSKGKELTHLSTRLRPSITMEILSCLQEKNSKQAAKVFSRIRQSTQARFEKGGDTAKWLASKIYNNIDRQPSPQKTTGLILRNKKLPLLLTKSNNVYRPINSLEQGCFRTGEKQFGCLDLTGNGNWSKFISDKLENVAQRSGVDIFLESAKKKADLPDSLLMRQQFWQDWANQGTQTILVVSDLLQNADKVRLQREALQANIALQFMLPMFKQEDYRIANIILGLLLKAKWQPVGLEPIQDEYAAEIVIGFDAGTDRNLYYGTSSFAILANGQSLGWEIPAAQLGETLSGPAVCRIISKIVERFYRRENRFPKRVLLLRDGIVQRDEFTAAVAALEEDDIAVDLLGVRKSGAGRMAVSPILPYQSKHLTDALPGTVVLSKDQNTFRIVTSEAKAGGSARPLQVVRDCGDAPLEILARQIDRLCILNPASAYAFSRLPYVIHFADKMAKTVQRLGEVGILQNLDREKIFFA